MTCSAFQHLPSEWIQRKSADLKMIILAALFVPLSLIGTMKGDVFELYAECHHVSDTGLPEYVPASVKGTLIIPL